MLRKKSTSTEQIDKDIDEIHNTLSNINAEDPEYADARANLEKMYELKAKVQKDDRQNRTTLKDWMPVIASIGGILVIVVFEQYGNVITSKSLSFVKKP